MLSEDQKRILGYFIEEAKDHLNTIEQGLLNLQATVEDAEMVNEVFRAAHSVKGGAAMLGLNTIQRTSHRLEDFFKLMKESPIQADRDLESMLLQIFDGLREQVEQLQSPYGFSDDQAQEILSALEPVFTQTEAHLQTLLEAAPAAAKVASVSAKPVAKTPAATSQAHPETSALQLVFQSDVPALLRDMLAIFKAHDNESTRRDLEHICQRLKSIGEQFELSYWCELISLANLAVTNSQQTFRSLAPIVIKDIKQAQELVLAGHAAQVVATAELLALVPVETQSREEDSALEALLAEALDDGTTREPDLADLFAAAENEDVNFDLLETDDRWLDQVTQTTDEVDDVDGLEAAFDSLASETLETNPADTPARPAGVEVGAAELNSLADLFEGDSAELDVPWEEDELIDFSPMDDDSDNAAPDLESDLADLLDTSETPGPNLMAPDDDDDLKSLFGQSLDDALAVEAGDTSEPEQQPAESAMAPELSAFMAEDSLVIAEQETTTEAAKDHDLGDFFAEEVAPTIASKSQTSNDIEDFFEDKSDVVRASTVTSSSEADLAAEIDMSQESSVTANLPSPPEPNQPPVLDPFSIDLWTVGTEEEVQDTDFEVLFDTDDFSTATADDDGLDATDVDRDNNDEEFLNSLTTANPIAASEIGEAMSDPDIAEMFDETAPDNQANEDSPREQTGTGGLDSAFVSIDQNGDTQGYDLSVAQEGTDPREDWGLDFDFDDPEAGSVTTDQDQDGLDNLLDEPVAVPDDEATSDSFDDLEALLEDDEPLSSTARPTDSSGGSTSIDGDNADDFDEFSDLEKLLEDTDQLGGTASTLVGRRSGTVPTARRAPRRTAGSTDQTMRVSVSHLDILSNLVGELVVNRNSLEQDQERKRQFLDNLLLRVQQLNDVGQRMRDLYERSLLESSLISSRQTMTTQVVSNGSDHATGAIFDALEMDRFTGFHTLSQEMIELIVRVREAASDIEFTVDSSDQITRQFRQVTTQLQEGLNKARMVPFGQTADRLPRAVRDISLKCGKEARLMVEGRDTLIDKMILERLYDPMTHLVNNAITHGIEPPEERLAQGKSREGTIMIRAFYQGNQTVIYIADDGGGINPDVVKAKALGRGLISSAEAATMSEVEVYDLLFLPGFSTRDQADDFSGRGVGMDVVRTALADIRGAITVESTLGQGTSFTIRLPLTLSITKALSCVNNQARIAFPMDGVEDMFDVPRERIQTNEQGVSCILWRDTWLPFRPLSELLQFNRSLGRGRVYGGSNDDNAISIVVLRNASTFIGLQVDQVIGEQEIVIKQLEGPVPKPTGIAGATVMGDGRVMPIADVLELIDLSTGRVRRESSSSLWAQPEEEAETQPVGHEEPTVLIVDDSITVRELLSMSFNKVGYRVEQARDGQEAWEKLRSGLPCDLVFCDIEMPRMDGLELLSRLQKDTQLSRIPIAMLTSRGADRHRQMAVDLGASGYFTKPYLEEMLLDAAQRMLNGERMIGAGTEANTQEM